ncbi:MAG: LysM peptidoglycan-binding domain-containing protein [Curvibacter sp.]|jgi:hypothetical protein|nr:LysM peptidoglycan-binding domain-containing protein [Curvibacter sp.]
MGISARVSIITALGLLSLPVWSQKFPNLPISAEQNATAQKVAQGGVPLSELVPNAPDTYVVKSGNTLWAISKLYLRSPWRWPELWGMNLEEIRNPHLIFPGQTLYLLKRDGRAMLTGTPPTSAPSGPGGAPAAASEAGRLETRSSAPETVRLSPRIRFENPRSPLSTVQVSAIEPFLAEPLIVEENELRHAPRIVAAGENRVIIGRGDRVYARGPAGAPLLDDTQKIKQFRIFRNAKALRDPETSEVLGYEAEFLGKAALARSEGSTEIAAAGRKVGTARVPATIDVTLAKSEILVGDRMVAEPEREFLNFVPRAPGKQVTARIVSIYGSTTVVNATENEVVVLNRGRRDGIESGHVLAILKDGAQLVDTTDPARPLIKLPDERSGLLMVFRVYEKLSYGLILDTSEPVGVGDRLISPE